MQSKTLEYFCLNKIDFCKMILNNQIMKKITFSTILLVLFSTATISAADVVPVHITFKHFYSLNPFYKQQFTN